MTATPSRPGRDRLAGIAGVDAGNAAQRKGRRPPAEHAGDARQTGRADRRIGIVLRGGGKHAADSNVIEQPEGRRLSLRHRLDRQPDDCVRAEEPPSILDRHVVLPHMDAVGAGGERDVDTIIDEQRDAEWRERRLDGTGTLDHGPRVAALVPKLDQRRAALRHQSGKLREIPPARVFGIDQGVEAKVDGHGATTRVPRRRSTDEAGHQLRAEHARSPLLRVLDGAASSDFGRSR